jgi:tRNA_anti-like
VSLEAGGDLIGVTCFAANPEPWSQVVPGQKVKLKGRWPPDGGGTLVDCVFVEVGEGGAISLSAENLAREYAADPEATTKKYDKKYLRISGEIADKEFNSAGAASVFLKGSGKVRVLCSFTAFENDLSKPLKAGQQVKLVGQYTLNFSKDEVGLYFCLPLKEP